MIAVIAALVPVFLLIVTGFALRRWLIQQDAHWIGLERILYYVMFPALLVESLSRADLAKVPVLAVGGTLLTAVLLMSALCLALRPLLARYLGADGAAFTSLFQGATRWQTFVALAVAGNLYGDLGLALGLLIVGAGLRVGELIHPNATMFLACALKLAVMPAIAISIGAALGLTGTTLSVVACCASVPASSNSYVLARQMGGDAPLMAQILTFQTALAAVTMPVILSLIS